MIKACKHGIALIEDWCSQCDGAPGTQKPVTIAHPFERTLGPGPYAFVGYFRIAISPNKGAHTVGAMHPRFVRGAGTCAHCGAAILNVYQVQTGNGDVFGVGCDCIEQVGIPGPELDKVTRQRKALDKQARIARLAENAAIAAATIQALLDAGTLDALPHPSVWHASQGKTRKDWAERILKYSTPNGLILAAKEVTRILEVKDAA